MKITSVLKEIIANLKRGVYKVFYKKQDGSMGEFYSAKRGNSAYASKTGKKIENYRQGFFKRAKNMIIIFITLTISYEKSYYGCEKSWLFFKKELSPFVKSLKNLGLEKYIISLESCEQGGCHAHLLTRWNKTIKSMNEKEKLILTEKIKEKWINRVKKTYPHTRKKNLITLGICQNLSDGKTLFNYVFKWIGKFSNIEKALERIQNGIGLKNDIPRLFANYWGYKLKIRLFRTSKGLASTI
jgi:hypothetical protein